MRNLLNYDGPVLRFITKIVYSVWLNILWFICCLPVITIGASTTALSYCTQKIARDEEGYITKAFFKSFKESFKQSTIIGLIMTVLGAFIITDGYVLIHLCFTSPFWTVVSAVFIIAAIAYVIVLLWIFPLHAHFENTIMNMFKNSIMIGMRFIVCTFIMICVYAIMFGLIFYVCFPLIIFGVGTCSLICAMLMKNIIIQCEGTN